MNVYETVCFLRMFYFQLIFSYLEKVQMSSATIAPIKDFSIIDTFVKWIYSKTQILLIIRRFHCISESIIVILSEFGHIQSIS